MPQTHILVAIYILSFLFNVHTALPTYIESSFLSEYATETLVGIIYTLGSLVSIIGLAFIPRILGRFGNFKVASFLFLLEIGMLIGLAISNSLFLIAPLFVVRLMLANLIYYNLDIFLEAHSTDRETGRLRSAYFTVANIAWVISPVIAGYLLKNGDFGHIFLLSAIFMTLASFFLIGKFKTFKDPLYVRVPFWKTFSDVISNENIRKIFFAKFLFYFFSVWMVIYTPIYLHEHIGFSWDKIGFMLAIILLPYIIFEIPAGKLADTKYGEKEMLGIGFLFMAFPVMALSFIEGPSFWAFTVALFLTRIGAALVEVMTESYFFKQVTAEKANIVGFFRNASPLAYLIAPLFGTLFLVLLPYQYIFVMLGIIMLSGLGVAFTLRDTR